MLQIEMFDVLGGEPSRSVTGRRSKVGYVLQIEIFLLGRSVCLDL